MRIGTWLQPLAWQGLVKQILQLELVVSLRVVVEDVSCHFLFCWIFAA